MLAGLGVEGSGRRHGPVMEQIPSITPRRVSAFWHLGLNRHWEGAVRVEAHAPSRGRRCTCAQAGLKGAGVASAFGVVHG